jgi:hypothetical protein
VLWVEEVACEVVVVVVWLESNKGKWEKLVASFFCFEKVGFFFFCFLLRVQIFSRCSSVYSHEKSQDCLVYLYIGPHLPIFSSILIFSFLFIFNLLYLPILLFFNIFISLSSNSFIERVKLLLFISVYVSLLAHHFNSSLLFF